VLTFTAMMYAMVKKVVRPARSSVVNLACRISLGFDSQFHSRGDTVSTYMTRSIQVEIPPNERARDSIVEGSFVALDEAHGRIFKTIRNRNKVNRRWTIEL
jgi:hypothetical protein